jgi:4-hydroxy-tetrahydrodipicolinate synthase
VTSNVVPDRVSEVVRLLAEGQLAAARRAHFALLELHTAMFLEPNPVPCKLALSLLDRMQPDVRLPLVGAGEMSTSRIAAAVRELGLLPGT